MIFLTSRYRNLSVSFPVEMVLGHPPAHMRGISSITLGYRGVRSLVARTAGGREAAGSSPVIPTSNYF